MTSGVGPEHNTSVRQESAAFERFMPETVFFSIGEERSPRTSGNTLAIGDAGMMATLVLNLGSSSLKASTFDGETRLASFNEPLGGALRRAVERAGHVEAVGYRIVHGGHKYRESAILTPDVRREIVKAREYAPLHTKRELEAIEEAYALLPHALHVTCFDTAFHRTVPEHAALYGLPAELQSSLHIRRYGFHGLSHQFASQRVAELMGRSDLRVITCHLGSGASVCAVRDGQSIDTSMGFTPLEGLVMGTRSGDIDAGLVIYLIEQFGLQEVKKLLIQESGLKGLSGVSNDIRDLEDSPDPRAALALEVFCYRVKKYIGAYSAVLGGLDALVFTGGIGEHSAKVRRRVLAGLEYLGIRIEDAGAAGETPLHKGEVAVWVIPAQEDLVIAREVLRLARSASV